jgi:hypothetical protein
MRLFGLAVVLACGLTLAPPAALALQAGKVYRIGIIDNEASLQAPRLAAFLKEPRIANGRSWAGSIGMYPRQRWNPH